MNPLPGQSGAATAQDDTIFRTLAAYADALDALPLDLTRSFSDLRELDAVLGAHLTSLTSRLQHLTAVIEDPDVSPGERLLALRDVAEEARGYKMGGEDKIRVAVTTAETIISHTDYIASLLANLRSVPSLKSHLLPSESQMDSLGNPILDGEYYDLGIGPSSHQSQAQFNNGYPGDTINTGASSSGGPKKRKVGMNDPKGKSSMNGIPDSGYVSNSLNPSVAAGGGGVGAKKRKTASGKESTSSNHASTGKEKEKSRKVSSHPSSSGGAALNQSHPSNRDGGSHRGSFDDSKPPSRNEASSRTYHQVKNGLGGPGSHSGSRGNSRSRDLERFDNDYDASNGNLVGGQYMVDSNMGGISQSIGSGHLGQDRFEADYRVGINQNPNQFQNNDPRFREGSNQLNYVRDSSRGMGGAQGQNGEGDEFYRRNQLDPSNNPSKYPHSNSNSFNNHLGNDGRRVAPLGNSAGGGLNSRIPSGNSNSNSLSRGDDDAQDETRYCYCDRVSFGEMMGCDDEDCPKEWFHLECTGYKAPPEGTWYCDICTEKRAKEAARGKGKAKGPYSRKGKR